jgi:DNA invertase Pin-like site-specific DNA recombinase
MASLAEFEHDLLRERVRSGVAAAKARGQTFGRRPGYRPSDKKAPEVVKLSEVEGLSQRQIAGKLGLSKTTVNEILKRRTQSSQSSQQAVSSGSPGS